MLYTMDIFSSISMSKPGPELQKNQALLRLQNIIKERRVIALRPLIESGEVVGLIVQTERPDGRNPREFVFICDLLVIPFIANYYNLYTFELQMDVEDSKGCQCIIL